MEAIGQHEDVDAEAARFSSSAKPCSSDRADTNGWERWGMQIGIGVKERGECFHAPSSSFDGVFQALQRG